jgi:hypothetical protein
MNEDHPDAVLAYAHYFAGQKKVSDSVLVDVREDYMTIESQLLGSTEAEPSTVINHIPFTKPISNIKDAEKTMVMMFFEARDALMDKQ